MRTGGFICFPLILELHAGRAFNPASAVAGIFTALPEARHDLRLTTVGPLSVAVTHGAVFDYFDEVRKVIGAAQIELFFVDPYLDSEFVSRYLSQVSPPVRVRLLGRKGMMLLLPAVDLMRKQTGEALKCEAAHLSMIGIYSLMEEPVSSPEHHSRTEQRQRRLRLWKLLTHSLQCFRPTKHCGLRALLNLEPQYAET